MFKKARDFVSDLTCPCTCQVQRLHKELMNRQPLTKAETPYLFVRGQYKKGEQLSWLSPAFNGYDVKTVGAYTHVSAYYKFDDILNKRIVNAMYKCDERYRRYPGALITSDSIVQINMDK